MFSYHLSAGKQFIRWIALSTFLQLGQDVHVDAGHSQGQLLKQSLAIV